MLRSMNLFAMHAGCRFSCVWLFVTPWIVAHQAPLFTGILQARILEWVAMPSSRESSRPRGRTQAPDSPTLAGRFFTISTTWETQVNLFTISQTCHAISHFYTSVKNVLYSTPILHWGIPNHLLRLRKKVGNSGKASLPSNRGSTPSWIPGICDIFTVNSAICFLTCEGNKRLFITLYPEFASA